jgi:hypothetical protein
MTSYSTIYRMQYTMEQLARPLNSFMPMRTPTSGWVAAPSTMYAVNCFTNRLAPEPREIEMGDLV